MKNLFLVDSHCHFHLLDLTKDDNDVSKIIARAQENGVHHFLNVCVTIKEFPIVLKAAEAYPFVSASIGLHPNEKEEVEPTEETLIQLGHPEKVVAIGETGLDYYRTAAGMEWQQNRFRTHIRAAKRLKKPLIIHTRQAKEDTIRIMREEGASEIGGVMHCFTEDWETARQALDLNFMISFSGIVTFKNATSIQEAAKKVPLDRMIIETDSPYLAPNPMRGKPNEPAYVRYTAEFLADMRQVSLENFAEQTTKNFFSLFKGATRLYV